MPQPFWGQYILNIYCAEALSKSRWLLVPLPSEPPHPSFSRSASKVEPGSVSDLPDLAQQSPNLRTRRHWNFCQQERLGRFLPLTPNLSSFYSYKQQGYLICECIGLPVKQCSWFIWKLWSDFIAIHVLYLDFLWHLWAQPCLHLGTTRFFTKSHLQ